MTEVGVLLAADVRPIQLFNALLNPKPAAGPANAYHLYLGEFFEQGLAKFSNAFAVCAGGAEKPLDGWVFLHQERAVDIKGGIAVVLIEDHQHR
ncbi:MAG: hypothetical protein D3903_17200 [Candidatus Electrothrix sp. GM3_4]|nr:hypothetical protein [Candidatus Electrothrix sp. GM3_4]